MPTFITIGAVLVIDSTGATLVDDDEGRTIDINTDTIAAIIDPEDPHRSSVVVRLVDGTHIETTYESSADLVADINAAMHPTTETEIR